MGVLALLTDRLFLSSQLFLSPPDTSVSLKRGAEQQDGGTGVFSRV